VAIPADSEGVKVRRLPYIFHSCNISSISHHTLSLNLRRKQRYEFTRQHETKAPEIAWRWLSFSVSFPSSQILNILSYHLSSCLSPLSTQQQQGLTTNSMIKSEGRIQTMAPRNSLRKALRPPTTNAHHRPYLFFGWIPHLPMLYLPRPRPSLRFLLECLLGWDWLWRDRISSQQFSWREGDGTFFGVFEQCRAPSLLGELMVMASARFERKGNYWFIAVWVGRDRNSREAPPTFTPCGKLTEADRGINVAFVCRGIWRWSRRWGSWKKCPVSSEPLYSPETEAVASTGVDWGGSCWGVYNKKIDPAWSIN